MAEQNDVTQILEKGLKEVNESLEKRLKASLEAERKTYEELLKAKAEGEAVSELQEKLARMEAEHTEAQKAFDKELAEMKLSASDAKGTDQEEEVKAAFFEVLRAGNDVGLQEKSKNLLADVLTKQYNACNDSPKSVEQIKSMLSGIDTSGGVLVVPPFLEASIHKFAKENVAVYDMASKTTISGPVYRRDARISTAGASWEGESDTWSATSTPEYGQIEINVHKLIAYPTVSRDLIEDARIDMDAEVMDFTREAFSDKIAKAMVNGTGKRQPFGFMTCPKAKESAVADNWGKLGFVVSGAAAGFGSDPAKADCLVDLQGILKDAYGNRATWLMNRATGTLVRKFKNSSGDYLWQPSLIAGQPATLLGMPVRYDENMPKVEAGSFPIALGDFNSGLLVVNRRGMTVIRDMTSKPGHVKFLIDMRMGSGVRNFEAIKLLKIAAS